jgi:hypothetical protein
MVSLFSRSSSAAHHGVALVVEVGSGGVVVSVIEKFKKASPVAVRIYKRAALPNEIVVKEGPERMQAIATLCADVIKGVSEGYTRSHKQPVMRVLVFLHAPWATSRTSDAFKRFESDIAIDRGTIAALAKEAVSAAGAQTAPDERSVVRIELNGYPTGAPEGKHASRARVVVLDSVFEPGIKQVIEQAIATHLPGRAISWFSMTHAVMSSLRPLTRTSPRYTCIDVTSEATSCFTVDEGMLGVYGHAPIGWRALLRALADKYKTSPEEALSRLTMTSEDSAEDVFSSHVVASLSDIAPQFIEAYGALFTSLTKERHVPSTLILVVPPDVSGWFVQLFSRIDFAPFSETGLPFAPTQLPMYLAERSVFEEGLAPDQGVAIVAAAIHSDSALL